MDNDSGTSNTSGYSDVIVNYIQNIYIIGIVIWILLIIMLDIYNTDTIGKFILFVPILIFLVSMYSFENCSQDLEEEMFQYDALYFGFIATLHY